MATRAPILQRSWVEGEGHPEPGFELSRSWPRTTGVIDGCGRSEQDSGADGWRWRRRSRLTTAVPAWARAQDRPTAAMDDQWHFDIAPYFWMPGVQGDVGVGEPAARLGRRVLLRHPRELRPRAPGALRGAQEPLRIRHRPRLDEPRRAGGGYAGRGSHAWTSGSSSSRASASTAWRAAGARTTRLTSTCWRGSGTSRCGRGSRARRPAARRTTRAFQDLDWVDALAGVKFRAPLGSKMSLLGTDRHRRLRLGPDLEPRGRPGLPGVPALDDRRRLAPHGHRLRRGRGDRAEADGRRLQRTARLVRLLVVAGARDRSE